MIEDAADLRALLDFLKRQRGFDFSGYKRRSLERRLAKRMGEVGIEGYDAYLDYLQVHPDEFATLFDTLLINVTSFFRDAPAWRFVADRVIPSVLAARTSGDIRVWSAGAASGEEAYTAAMLLIDAMGEEDFRRRVKIYATDIDEKALEQARHGVYPMQAVKDVEPRLVERCFDL